MKKGKIQVKSENILPIIKKWLYSDKDIFLREVISNSSDAIFKLERLAFCGEVNTDDNYEIIVSVNQNERLVTISDNGIGMTESEIKNYIAQVAFSGAADFVEKYRDSFSTDGIIGHFGLGFYSVFMVSDFVEIDTLSYIPESTPVKWICDGGATYQIGNGSRTKRGTTLTLHISEDSKEFLEISKIKEIIKKYCSFITYDIILIDEATQNDNEKMEPINSVKPLWLRHASECSDEDYKAFYREVFNDYRDPLFWIHLNVDSPFQLKSIIYFPKFNNDTDISSLGEIKLYNNQVFVADNIKEILPEFLMVLKGIIDCPDIPVNVSRSALQNDGSVKRISTLIAKKISDKLYSIFNKSRDEYINYWDSIHILVKYGCIRDKKFYERIKDAILYKTIDGEYFTIPEYLERTGEQNTSNIYYCDNKSQQSTNISMYKKNNIPVIDLTHPIDLRLIQEMEMDNNNLKFICVTSEIPNEAVTGQVPNANDLDAITDLFKRALDNDKLIVKAEYFKDDTVAPLLLSLSEESKRYNDMRRNMGGAIFGASNLDEYIITLNCSHPLYDKLVNANGDNQIELLLSLCKQLYTIALMSHRELKDDEKQEFVNNEYMLFESML